MSSTKLPELAPTTEEPTFLSTLTFVSCLGHGGFGIVLQALDPSSPQSTTAVKFIFLTEQNEKERLQILRECELAATFNHDNIVRILTVFKKSFTAAEIESIFDPVTSTPSNFRLLSLVDMHIGQARRYMTMESICIQMELCAENLRLWLGQPHDRTELQFQGLQLRIILGIVRGLHYLHGNKIIHRDIKPENIMFSKASYTLPVKIGDFGLCRILHSTETQTSSLTSRTGTAEYMAPEVTTADYSFQADLFSLGLVIWEVIQLIKFQERRILFDRLVNDKEVELVKVEDRLEMTADIIVNLTKRRKADRIQNINEILPLLGILEKLHMGGDIFVRTSEELEICLKYVAPGGKLVLRGIYNGRFPLARDNIVIVGLPMSDGSKTVLRGYDDRPCLDVEGSGCAISGIKVITGDGISATGIQLWGSRNTLKDVEVEARLGGTCIIVRGDENRLQDLVLSKAMDGIVIKSCSSTVIDGLLMQNIALGIYAHSTSHKTLISNVSGAILTTGIVLAGNNNELSKITLTRSAGENEQVGVVNMHGSFNTVSDLNCFGYTRQAGDWGLKIGSSEATVNDCIDGCGPVWIDGFKVTLTNVNCGGEIEIGENAEGINLLNCRGSKLVFIHKPATLTDCNFDEILVAPPKEPTVMASSEDS